MSLITRCPHCSTRYKVIPDQLRLASGWVRCGQCHQMFDGRANLIDGAEPATQPPSAQPPAPQPAPPPPAPPAPSFYTSAPDPTPVQTQAPAHSASHASPSPAPAPPAAPLPHIPEAFRAQPPSPAQPTAPAPAAVQEAAAGASALATALDAAPGTAAPLPPVAPAVAPAPAPSTPLPDTPDTLADLDTGLDIHLDSFIDLSQSQLDLPPEPEAPLEPPLDLLEAEIRGEPTPDIEPFLDLPSASETSARDTASDWGDLVPGHERQSPSELSLTLPDAPGDEALDPAPEPSLLPDPEILAHDPLGDLSAPIPITPDTPFELSLPPEEAPQHSDFQTSDWPEDDADDAPEHDAHHALEPRLDSDAPDELIFPDPLATPSALHDWPQEPNPSSALPAPGAWSTPPGEGLDPALDPAPDPWLNPALDPAPKLPPAPAPDIPPLSASDTDDAVALSFVTRAERRAFWRTPAMRAVLGLTALVLALVLASQLAVQHRDWLAARHPGLTGTLNRLCQPFDCVVQPWRGSDAVVIDNSSFTRASEHSFRFTLTLRNTAHMPVATPALELILTDANQQTLLRRVVLPHELELPPTLAARSEFETQSLINLARAARPEAVVNYRLMAFYP